jgi:sarcosine oxidase subunit gamma
MPSIRRPQLVPFAGMQTCPPVVRLSLRGDLAGLASALAPLPVSQQACRAMASFGCTALWLGPDEQLLLAPDPVDARVRQILEEHLQRLPHSLVDISQGQTAFEIAGSHARTLLGAGCPLDLSDEAFPLGMCTRTVFEKSGIVLWRTAADTFRIEVVRSFALYVTGLLAQAARELGA